MAKHQGGVAVATVKDGHVMVFSKQVLLNLLKQASDGDKEHVVVFIKRAGFSA